jgi:ATP-dependent DNA helicase RecG
MFSLTEPITKLPGVGQVYQERLGRLGIGMIQDLLFHFPVRFLDFSQLTPIDQLTPGQIKAIQGRVIAIKNRPAQRRRMTITEAMIKDNSATIKAVWFNQPYLEDFLADREVLLAGKVKRFRQAVVLASPEFELKKREQTHIGRIVPIYPETNRVSSKWLRSKLKLVVNLTDQITDFLPRKIRNDYQLIELPEAIRQIHFPDSQESIGLARRRLAFNELFLITLRGQLSRVELRKSPAFKIAF